MNIYWIYYSALRMSMLLTLAFPALAVATFLRRLAP